MTNSRVLEEPKLTDILKSCKATKTRGIRFFMVPMKFQLQSKSLGFE